MGGFYEGVIENFSVNTATNQGKSVRKMMDECKVKSRMR